MASIQDEFALLMAETSSDSPIDDTRNMLRKFVDHMKELPEQEEAIPAFAQLRDLHVDTLKAAEGFWYPENYPIPDIYTTADLNLHRFEGRFIYPVKTAKGAVAGIVGYDNTVMPKYLDSDVYGYKAKSTMFYGMENIKEYYESKEPVIFTEGCVCALILREKGFQALALLGSYLSPYMCQIIKRFGYRAIMIPDADETGAKLAKQIPRKLPEARILRTVSEKDVDDSRDENPEFFDNLRWMCRNAYDIKRL